MISGTTRLAGVIGHPVDHSLSPALHNAAFAAAGLDWVYAAFDVAPGGAGEALAAMRALGLGGLSVTMPHKEQVAELVDVVDPAAAALRSVNTVVRLSDGRLAGHSTDGDGFVESLRAAGHDPKGLVATVVGAGAAARAVVDALARAGIERVFVANRTRSKAVAAAALAGDRGETLDVAGSGCDLLINATSVGMASDALPIDPAIIHQDMIVADLVYHPLETALLRAAASAGARTVDGLGMLVHQAVLQQQLWTGVRPDPAVMRAAALRELAARDR